MKMTSPESVGIRTEHVHAMLASLVKRKIHMHSLLLMRGNNIFLDCYWKPFHEEYLHRMYSQTKSFVSVAVGLAEEDGLIDLDAPIASYFPEKIDTPLPDVLKEQTVRQMLTMTTVGKPKISWFRADDPDRTHLYFSNRSDPLRPAGTAWEYDSAGSQVLCALVEKVTGCSLFDYLNQRIFRKLGAFENAQILKTPNGNSWGDSALICTPHDMAVFARFVMNYGEWKGERLMNEAYLRTATTKQVHNATSIHDLPQYHGYGYQFWMVEGGGFAFVGMGDQLTVCMPEQDLIMVCTADNQGSPFARGYIFSQFLDCIVANAAPAPLPEDPATLEKLKAFSTDLTLHAATGDTDSPWRQKLHGVSYRCLENPLGWESFSLRFEDACQGTLRYVKGGMEKELPFAVNANRFSKFPEDGYSHLVGGIPSDDGYRYDCAVSAAWLQENKLMLCVQIIDIYFGNLALVFSFRDDAAVVTAQKNAEHFLDDYQGEIIATRAC